MQKQEPNICFVSACPVMGESIYARLAKEGFQVDWIRDSNQALVKIRSNEYDAVVADRCLPYMNGGHFLRELSADAHSAPPTLLIAEHDSLGQSQNPRNHGVDCAARELDHGTLVEKIKEICCPKLPDHSIEQDCPLGISPAMRHVEEKIQTLAPYHHTPVLILGESGVGKEVVAQRLHAIQNSPGPFIAINCVAIPHSLIESELFGHEKGAFTGSTKSHKGVFEQANGGTLFLDEIGEMPLSAQAKLLRAIQEKVVVRVGGEQDIPVNLRIICATNCDLLSRVESGRFREDLFYRINVIELHIPPLRQREEDILWLANEFLNLHAGSYSGKVKNLDRSAIQALLEHSWPGNVRELKNSIERTCIMTPGPKIFAHDLFPQQTACPNEENNVTLKSFLQAREHTYINITLKENNGAIMSTARKLGISRKALWEKMKKYDIQM